MNMKRTFGLATFALCIAVLTGAIGVQAADQSPPPRMIADSPTAERNIKNFMQYQEDGVKREFSRLDKLVAPVVLLRSGGSDSLMRLLGKEDPKRPVSANRDDLRKRSDSFAGVEGHHRVMEEIYGIGDTVIARWRIKGVVKGTLFGLQGNGRPIDVTEIAFARFDSEGRFMDGWFREDTTELLRQLGYTVTAPAP